MGRVAKTTTTKNKESLMPEDKDTLFDVTFKLMKETKGAALYEECDPKTLQILPYGEFKVGKQYFRKSAFDDRGWPAVLEYTVKVKSWKASWQK